MTKAEFKKNEFDFEKDLSIDKFKLDEECLSHASLYFRYADACQKAKSNVNRLDDKLKLIMAETSISIRKQFNESGVKTTEAMLASELEKHNDVIEAKEELREAQEIYSRLIVAVQAMDARRSELDNLVKLYCSGYYAVADRNNSARNNINEQVGREIRKGLKKKE